MTCAKEFFLSLFQDEGSMHFKKAGRNAIKAFGSKFVDQVRWRDTWVYISKKPNTWLAENIQKNVAVDKWAPPAIVQVSLTLTEKEESCDYGEGKVAERRKAFCEKFEGYGSVCTCKYFESCN